MISQKMEFHISKLARDKYQFNSSIFELDGTVLLGNFNAARLLASRMNNNKDLINFPESAVRASEIYAIGLIDEIFHYLFKMYKGSINPEALTDAIIFLENSLSKPDLNKLVENFIKEFPPKVVYTKEVDISKYLEQVMESQEFAPFLEEIIMLWLENQNPALHAYQDLFYDADFSSNTKYEQVMDLLHNYFEIQPHFGPENQNLILMLRTPSITAPHSIHQQLEYIRTHWGSLLGDLLYKLIRGIDFINEEIKPHFFGPGKDEVPEYRNLSGRIMDMDLEKENFSPDKDWMPNLVLLAKNTYVWLDQMRKKYKLPISTLDEIPEQELEIIRDRGFNGLWLIGLWERSNASATIKQLCGNQEAIASAYSLAGYQIASELGGEPSYQRLRDRAWQKGIRLAADMVPNHMGIDSDWVYEHPEWFIQVDSSPFPSYSFSGHNLSKYDSYEVKIEDHYYDRTDAAVVFLFKNVHTGQTRFIYHGNDGTTMPWNDTAQLNYLLPEVREAVYQTILSVAKRFPIIRFDAAMTLAKKHYQRLWFPEPGTGGAIPSRAEYGLTKSDFDRILPNEFWREVVDRLSVDAPDTLLLAEAFWLMESYFVRSLGMHRVYNSAFMNMLRNEDNANYRQLIKNTIEFDPQILKRFVNFMNNPDEKTASEQFGKGDKYFGICSLMSTLPGLPMFGHGQFEGFTEKYGMEFKKAYWEEQEDQNLINRHKNQISPLLHRRIIFSEVENFLFYDFFTMDHSINEDVYAYSNYYQGQASFVIYNNKFADTWGYIKQSATRIKISGNGSSAFRTVNLADGLHLSEEFDYVIYRDITSNLEFIQSIHNIRENGLTVNLYAYQSHVFVDFKQIKDDQWQTYKRLDEYLNGNGVPNINEALSELMMSPIHTPIKELINQGFFNFLYKNRRLDHKEVIDLQTLKESQTKTENLLREVSKSINFTSDTKVIVQKTLGMLEFFLSIPILDKKISSLKNKEIRIFVNEIQKLAQNINVNWLAFQSFIFLQGVGFVIDPNNFSFQNQSLFKEWKINKIIIELGSSYKLLDSQIHDLIHSIYTLLGLSDWFQSYSADQFEVWFNQLLSKNFIQEYLQVNRYKEQLWFNKERFESLISLLMIVAVTEIGSDPKITTSSFIEELIRLATLRKLLISRLEKSNFLFKNLLIE